MWLFHPARIHVAGLGTSFAEDQGPESSLVNLNAHGDTPVQVGTAHEQVPTQVGLELRASPLDLVVFPDSHPQPPDRTPQQLGEQAHLPYISWAYRGVPAPQALLQPLLLAPGAPGAIRWSQLTASSQGKTSWGSPGSGVSVACHYAANSFPARCISCGSFVLWLI